MAKYKLRQLLNGFASRMLNNPTPAETWAEQILKKAFGNFAFVKQHIFRKKIFDFYFPHIMCRVEIDGGYHEKPEQKEKDQKDDSELLKECQILTLRCKNFDEARIQEIISIIQTRQKVFSEKKVKRKKKRDANKEKLFRKLKELELAKQNQNFKKVSPTIRKKKREELLSFQRANGSRLETH